MTRWPQFVGSFKLLRKKSRVRADLNSPPYDRYNIQLASIAQG